ncbi:uncharacterized protein RSE6_03639 [Rhynchosporium secalis]|uniref:Uncharacterized protein n=1 Tax=Rhynchosporium secalis TaxID=38038 RepID=A0A1E1M392_RHYSE|nr:uncharacterized protein RSE6_03639 [Rhynchosporium secalis]
MTTAYNIDVQIDVQETDLQQTDDPHQESVDLRYDMSDYGSKADDYPQHLLVCCGSDRPNTSRAAP